MIRATFGLSHARVHTALLPFSIAYNEEACPDAVAQIAAALGTEEAAAGLWDLIKATGGPVSLRVVGLKADDVAKATELAVAGGAAYKNPREVTWQGVNAMLFDAYHGRRPGNLARRSRWFQCSGEGPHAQPETAVVGPPLWSARVAVVCLHGRGGSAEAWLRDIKEHLGGQLPPDTIFVAPQAMDSTWYPHSFLEPREKNQPKLDSALSIVSRTLAEINKHVPPERVILAGFSQGACLAASYVAEVGTIHCRSTSRVSAASMTESLRGLLSRPVAHPSLLLEAVPQTVGAGRGCARPSLP